MTSGGISMFTCKVSQHAFKWEKSLKRDMESIHYGNILSCKGRTRTFNRIDNFERHKRCMHIGHIMCGTADFLE